MVKFKIGDQVCMVGGLVGQHYLGLTGTIVKVYEPSDNPDEPQRVSEYVVDIPHIGQRSFPEFLLASAPTSERLNLGDMFPRRKKSQTHAPH